LLAPASDVKTEPEHEQPQGDSTDHSRDREAALSKERAEDDGTENEVRRVGKLVNEQSSLI
jgi:hypothetical protein